MRVSHCGLRADIIAAMQHTPSRLESVVMVGKASPTIWGLGGPLIALCNDMLSSVSMNVKLFPPPHYFLSSLKHNVTVPTKAQFTEAGSRIPAEAPHSEAALGCSFWEFCCSFGSGVCSTFMQLCCKSTHCGWNQIQQKTNSSDAESSCLYFVLTSETRKLLKDWRLWKRTAIFWISV